MKQVFHSGVKWNQTEGYRAIQISRLEYWRLRDSGECGDESRPARPFKWRAFAVRPGEEDQLPALRNRNSANSVTLSAFDQRPTRPASFSVSSRTVNVATSRSKRTTNSAPLKSTRIVCHARG